MLIRLERSGDEARQLLAAFEQGKLEPFGVA